MLLGLIDSRIQVVAPSKGGPEARGRADRGAGVPTMVWGSVGRELVRSAAVPKSASLQSHGHPVGWPGGYR